MIVEVKLDFLLLSVVDHFLVMEIVKIAVAIMNMGQEMKIDYKGVLSGGELKLSFDMMGQTTEMVLKKAK